MFNGYSVKHTFWISFSESFTVQRISKNAKIVVRKMLQYFKAGQFFFFLDYFKPSLIEKAMRTRADSNTHSPRGNLRCCIIVHCLMRPNKFIFLSDVMFCEMEKFLSVRSDEFQIASFQYYGF